MFISTNQPGRIAGSVLVLQTMMAQMFATHPEGKTLFDKMRGFPTGLEPDASCDKAQFDFRADLAAGAQDTLDAIESAVMELGGFKGE